MRVHHTDQRPGGWQFTMLDRIGARWRGEPVSLGPPQRNAVLAVLLLNAGCTVTTKYLIDAVWGENPPAKAPATVQAHISALRKMLEPDREPHAPSRIIRSVNRNYLVDPGDVDLDVTRFQDTVAAADRARAQGDLGLAATLLRGAFAEFRATALPGVPGPFAAQQRDALTEQRLSAYLDLVELDLLGQPDEPVDHDLTELIENHPYQERLLAVHLRLLHHNGRRADALAAYTAARRTLISELGVEPGVELRRLQHRLLAGDAGGPVTIPRLVGGKSPVIAPDDDQPASMPRQQRLVGRGGVLADLADGLTPRPGGCAPIVVLHGPPGIGKTATAVRAGQMLADRFPGGRFFLSADAESEYADDIRRTAERATGRSLLIIDDVPPTTDVRPELPESQDVAVLITSRSRGRLMPFAQRIEVPPLVAETARELLRGVVSPACGERDAAALDRLVSLTAGVPGVLLSIAELLRRRPEWSVADYVDHLVRDGDWSLDVHLRPLFDRSYAELDPLLAKAFRLAAVPGDGPLSAGTVAAACGLPPQRVALLLEELVDRNMLATSAPGSYRFPPLLRRYAYGLATQVESEEQLARAAHPARPHAAPSLSGAA